MARIRPLSNHLINIIAAGEVIERPANVVKELVENSLDAGASEVEVEIEKGGKGLVLVQDNGEGMDEEDLPLAVQSHATSKIYSLEHLTQISSFGFRGEALSSIGAVSHLKICSITPSSEIGACIEVEFGELGEVYPCALSRGTRVEVRDLFLRTPARLKFLRSTATEARRCQDIFVRMALAHLDKRFSFKRQGSEVFLMEEGEALRTRLARVWPSSVVEEMLEIEDVRGYAKIKGLVSPPHLSQKRGNRIMFYVNSRPIQDRLLMRSLSSAYEGKLLSREFPCAILFLELPPSKIDINVHPSKEEVRFRDESLIFSLVHNAVKQVIDPPPVHTSFELHSPPSPYGQHISFPEVSEKGESRGPGREVRPPFAPTPETGELPSEDEGFSYLGQVLDSYLVISVGGESLLIVDQHAAHERVLYERYIRSPRFYSQPLHMPLVVDLPPSVEDSFLSHLKKVGFEFELKGNCLVLHSYPSILKANEVKEVLEGTFSSPRDRIKEMYRLMACKRAIKAKTPLAPHEAMALLRSWFNTPEREFCPHGRPTVIYMDEETLEKMFKRRA